MYTIKRTLNSAHDILCKQKLQEKKLEHKQARSQLESAMDLFFHFRRRVQKEESFWSQIVNVKMLGMLNACHVSEDDMRTFYAILHNCYFIELDEV